MTKVNVNSVVAGVNAFMAGDVVVFAHGAGKVLEAHAAVGGLRGRAQHWQMLAGYMTFDSNGILGLPISVAATVVITFILFGNLLATTGGTKFFTDITMLAWEGFAAAP